MIFWRMFLDIAKAENPIFSEKTGFLRDRDDAFSWAGRR
jgi:hypothetical protein